jgi:hypothetical protein
MRKRIAVVGRGASDSVTEQRPGRHRSTGQPYRVLLSPYRSDTSVQDDPAG